MVMYYSATQAPHPLHFSPLAFALSALDMYELLTSSSFVRSPSLGLDEAHSIADSSGRHMCPVIPAFLHTFKTAFCSFDIFTGQFSSI